MSSLRLRASAAVGDVRHDCSQLAGSAFRVRYYRALQLGVEPTAMRLYQFDFANVLGLGLQDLVTVEIEGVLIIPMNKTGQGLIN